MQVVIDNAPKEAPGQPATQAAVLSKNQARHIYAALKAMRALGVRGSIIGLSTPEHPHLSMIESKNSAHSGSYVLMNSTQRLEIFSTLADFAVAYSITE